MEQGSGQKPKDRVGRGLELAALVTLLAFVPVTLVGVVLPINEYAWLADGGSVPPDCDIEAGLFLVPTALAGGLGLLGFGYLTARRRSTVRVVALVLSTVMFVATSLKLPALHHELTRAGELCSE